nr:putative reverse transcriptase domain-containing protein [Tanacetum cinerariifolium]
EFYGEDGCYDSSIGSLGNGGTRKNIVRANNKVNELESLYDNFFVIKVSNGQDTWFWLDPRCNGGVKLSDTFPKLYALEEYKDCKIGDRWNLINNDIWEWAWDNSDVQVPLDEIEIDENLYFVEEPIEIVERDVKKLKRRRIPLVKIRWNSRQGAEYTWELEDQFRKKYPHLFTEPVPSSRPRPSEQDEIRVCGECAYKRSEARETWIERERKGKEKWSGMEVQDIKDKLRVAGGVAAKKDLIDKWIEDNESREKDELFHIIRNRTTILKQQRLLDEQ